MTPNENDTRGVIAEALSALPSPGALVEAIPVRGVLAGGGLVAVLVAMASTFGLAGVTMTMMGLAVVTFGCILWVTSSN
ncbi:MAG: hypothetical protein EA355_12130 [Rhodobacteraceae bacterium]|nr:MAG: hypothetical protein EA355_12130 [Paracoccaceae bacterium]